MNGTHTTTTALATYIRILLVLFISVLFVALIPYGGPENASFLSNQLFNVGFLFGITAGFMISISLARKQAIEEYISLELNKIRRMYHLGYHLSLAEPQLRPWFKGLRAELDAYLGGFQEHQFYRYEEGNQAFRRVTYAVYGLPKLGIPYNADLYASLLDAAGTTTEAREYIRSKKNAYIGRFQWLVIIILAVTFAVILAGATKPDLLSRVASAVVIFNLYLVLHLLFEYDHPNKKKNRILSDRYVKNAVAFEKK